MASYVNCPVGHPEAVLLVQARQHVLQECHIVGLTVVQMHHLGQQRWLTSQCVVCTTSIGHQSIPNSGGGRVITHLRACSHVN